MFLDKWLSFSITDSFPITSLLLNLHCFPINGKITSFFDTWILMTSSCLPVQFHLALWPNFTLYSLQSSSTELWSLSPSTHDTFYQNCLCLSRLLALPGHTAASISSSLPPPTDLSKVYWANLCKISWDIIYSKSPWDEGSGCFSELSWRLFRSHILAVTLCSKSTCFAFPFSKVGTVYP